MIQNPPNAGVQTAFLPITLGAALAALTVTGDPALRGRPPTGAATDLGAIGTGAPPLSGLAVGQTAVR